MGKLKWLIREEPYLTNYLDQPLKDIASAQIKALWVRRSRGEVAPRIRNTHLDSLYVLTGLIRALHDGRLLKGQNCGPHDDMTRYYAHPIARKDPVAAGCPNTTFRAEALEQPLLRALVETLKALPELKADLRWAVEEVLKDQRPSTPSEPDELKRELDTILAKIKMTFDIATPDTQEESKARLTELGQRRRELERLIRQAKETEKDPMHDIETIVESLAARLNLLADQMDDLPIYQLRQVLAALTNSLTANMLTREVVMDLRVPPMAVSDLKTAIPELCLQTTSESSTVSATQLAPPPVLATIRCEYERVEQKQCYRCRRMPRAA